MACATNDIKINLGLNICTNPLAQGVGEMILLGRFLWIDTQGYDATNAKIINALTLKTGKKLLRYYGQYLSNQLTQALTTSDYGNGVSQTVRFILFSKDAAEEAELDSLLQLKDLFAIIPLNGNPVVYKVAGWKTGLKVTSLASDSNDATLKGAYTIELTADGEKTTVFTFQHKTSGADDTASYLENLALAVS